MPVGQWNLQWLNHNSQRRYPLADDASATDETGAFALPDDFLLELDLPVHAGLNVGPGRFYVKHVGAYATGYSVVVGYDGADGPVDVATALIARQTHTRNAVYALGGVGAFADTVGKVVIGQLDDIDAQPPGFWTFGPDGGRLDPDAVRPIIRGVSAIVLVNGAQSSAPLYGVVELEAGANVQLVPVLVAGQNPKVIVNAVQGAGLNEECVCEGSAAPGPPVLTVNGVAPGPDGNLLLVGNDCLEVGAIANGIRLSDRCSKPCCSCAELEKVTAALEQLGQDVAAVRQFVDRLDVSVTTMDMVVLGARLGPRSCTTCE